MFVALTTERSVEPPSAFFSTYVLAVAPLIAAQLPPFSSQRCHTYVKVGVGVPVQVPLVVVSVEPTLSSPLMTGGAVLFGTVWLAASPVRATPNATPIPSAASTSSRSGCHGRRRL